MLINIDAGLYMASSKLVPAITVASLNSNNFAFIQFLVHMICVQ